MHFCFSAIDTFILDDVKKSIIFLPSEIIYRCVRDPMMETDHGRAREIIEKFRATPR